MAVIKLDYVNEYTDRTGKKRRYFRRRGKRLGALPGEVGSEEFMAAYQGFLAENKPAIPSPRTGDGSFGRLITEYYGSTPFKNLKPSSRTAYRYALEPLAKAHGHRLVRDMRADKIAKIIGDIGATKPGMANFTKSVVQKLMKYAVKAKWRPDNPVIGIERFKSGTHHTWTEGELKTFESRWPLGTRERVAYALLLYTIQRVGDVAKMRRADIVDGELHVIQDKTGAELYLPILPTLAQAMKAYPAKGLALIGTENGKPLRLVLVYPTLWHARLTGLVFQRNAFRMVSAKPGCAAWPKLALRKSRSQHGRVTRHCARSSVTRRLLIRSDWPGMQPRSSRPNSEQALTNCFL